MALQYQMASGFYRSTSIPDAETGTLRPPTIVQVPPEPQPDTDVYYTGPYPSQESAESYKTESGTTTQTPKTPDKPDPKTPEPEPPNTPGPGGTCGEGTHPEPTPPGDESFYGFTCEPNPPPPTEPEPKPPPPPPPPRNCKDAECEAEMLYQDTPRSEPGAAYPAFMHTCRGGKAPRPLPSGRAYRTEPNSNWGPPEDFICMTQNERAEPIYWFCPSPCGTGEQVAPPPPPAVDPDKTCCPPPPDKCDQEGVSEADKDKFWIWSECGIKSIADFEGHEYSVKEYKEGEEAFKTKYHAEPSGFGDVNIFAMSAPRGPDGESS